jgi:GntR family transcriptional regulator
MMYHAKLGDKPTRTKYPAQVDGLGDPDKWDQPDRKALDRRGGPMGNPVYRQIAEDLRAEIESGALEPGQQLRTELELRHLYEASRNTVRDAIKWLVNLGLVETRPGQGTFVVKKVNPFVTTLSGDRTGLGIDEGVRKRDEVSKQNRQLSTSPVQVEIQEAGGEIAAALGLKLATEIISRHERRYVDGTPWSMKTSYYPIAFADRGAERLRGARNIDEGTVQYLKESLGISQQGYRDWILVRAPNPTEADFFRLPSDGRVPMYQITRTAYDGNQTPMRVTVTVYPADRNQFIVNSGEVPPLENRMGGGSQET